MFDLPFLFGCKLKVTGPGTGAAIAGHEATQGLDFSDNSCEVELLDLGFDLGCGFVNEGCFAQVRLAVPPSDIQAGRLFGDELFQQLRIYRAVFLTPRFCGRTAGEISPRSVRGKAKVVRVIPSEDKENRGSHVQRDESQLGTALLVRPGGRGSFPMIVGGAEFPDKIVFRYGL